MSAHSSGRIVSGDDTRWICKCGEVFTDDAAWRAHHDATERPDVDPPGTCHQIGCDGKGTKDEHVDPTAIVTPQHVAIGAGTWQDYTRVDHCLGYPQIKAGSAIIYILCSLSGPWTTEPRMTLTPAAMAELVDQHRAGCSNRSAR